MMFNDDDDDDDLNLALNDASLQKLLDNPTTTNGTNKINNIDDYNGFNRDAGDSWIYPNNLPLRSYQHSITQSALYRNTLVVLPTGLGKTFIAAVVMYNIHRWYPNGKIIFMAPTRPLVSQQIAACQKIMPFPADDTVELTGKLPKQKRLELWNTKRVFFATPQVVYSDINANEFPYQAIKLLVIDEAHKAKGKYAYTQVTEAIYGNNQEFRMLALTATPGRTIDDVAIVCRNLYISNLEIRFDNSIDVLPYVHQRTTKTIVVSLDGDDCKIKQTRTQLLEIIDPYLRELIAANVLSGGALSSMNRNYLLFEQKRFLDRAAAGDRHPEHNAIYGNFSMCISLYHALELLERHGLRVFVNNFDEDEDGRLKVVMLRDCRLRDLVAEARQQLGPNPFDISTHTMTNGLIAQMPTELDFGHPKFEKARNVLVDHFQDNPESRAIVFCEYRESVMLIHRLLLQHRPLLRPRCFVGQGGGSGTGSGPIRALTQKQQIEIMNDFRSGASNILVATSIGEEGIDVGEVELIVCFDICTTNPTRFVQRIGRTGRQKRGHVVMLVTEGREHRILKEVMAAKDKTNRKILQSTIVRRSLYPNSPRLVPNGFNPKCLQKFIIIEEAVGEVKVKDKPKPKSKSKSSKQKQQQQQQQQQQQMVQSQDLRKYFQPTAASLPPPPPPPPLRPMDTQDRLVFESDDKEEEEEVNIPVINIAPENMEEDEEIPVIPVNDKQPQRIRKLNRLLMSTKPILTESQRNQSNLFTKLQDKNLPHSLKLYLLKNNSQIIKEIHQKIQLQTASTKKQLNSRQQRTKSNYDLILEICNNDVMVLEQLMQLQSSETLMQSPELTAKEKKFQCACAKVFHNLDDQGFCSDNYNLIQTLLDKYENRQMERTFESEQQQQQQYNGTLLGNSELLLIDDENNATNIDDNNYAFNQSHSSHIDTSTATTTTTTNTTTNDLSVVDASDLSINLSRLNNLFTTRRPTMPIVSVAASTPINNNVTKKHSLSNRENNYNSKKQRSLNNGENNTPKSSVINDEFDIDLDDFMEPFPEELNLQSNPNPMPNNVERTPPYRPPPPPPLSPDLFGGDSMSPWKPRTPSEIKQSAVPMVVVAPKTPPPSTTSIVAPKTPNRSTIQQSTNANDKSPTVFELYLKRMRSRPIATTNSFNSKQKTDIPQTNNSNNNNGDNGDNIDDDSVIIRRQAKRKLIESDTDENDENDIEFIPNNNKSNYDDDDDDDDYFEQVPATQMNISSSPILQSLRRQQQRQQQQQQQHFKRRKLNSFIELEANKSGSGHDEDIDNEQSIGCYIKDSIIVSSDDDDDDDDNCAGHNDTDAHALYLQALKSPIQRPGAFKIPAPRRYNDDSEIFSQFVEPESSQYLQCSFIVDNDESHEVQNISECPLERAERILKEQKRQKRRAKQQISSLNSKSQPKRRRIQRISNSSSDDDVAFIE